MLFSPGKTDLTRHTEFVLLLVKININQETHRLSVLFQRYDVNVFVKTSTLISNGIMFKAKNLSKLNYFIFFLLFIDVTGKTSLSVFSSSRDCSR